jgi:hypothetical protein
LLMTGISTAEMGPTLNASCAPGASIRSKNSAVQGLLEVGGFKGWARKVPRSMSPGRAFRRSTRSEPAAEFRPALCGEYQASAYGRGGLETGARDSTNIRPRHRGDTRTCSRPSAQGTTTRAGQHQASASARSPELWSLPANSDPVRGAATLVAAQRRASCLRFGGEASTL